MFFPAPPPPSISTLTKTQTFKCLKWNVHRYLILKLAYYICFFFSRLQQKISICNFFSSKVNEDVGWCKLTTPDGVQQLIKISHPGIYERYK